jgi:hypothetical protein
MQARRHAIKNQYQFANIQYEQNKADKEDKKNEVLQLVRVQLEERGLLRGVA